jgi:hypothetical protein
LFLRLARQAERLRVMLNCCPARKANHAVGRIKSAEIAAPATATTAATKASSPEAAALAAKSTAATKAAAACKDASALSCPARTTARTLPAVLRPHRLDEIADPVHIHAGQGAHRPGLPGNRHRIAAEIRIARDRRKRSAGGSGRRGRAGFGVARKRAHQAQALRSIPRQLANRLLHLRRLSLLLPLLFSCARRQHQVKIHGLVMTGRVEQRLLRSHSKRSELGANHIAAICGMAIDQAP